MTPAQAEIIRRSHFRLMARAGQLVDLFITRLRLLDPTLAGLHVQEGDDSGFPLVQWLGAVVALGKNPPLLQRSVQGMVRRLGAEGVTPARVSHISQALLASVRAQLGRHWDSETAEAWNAFVAFICMSMMLALTARAVDAEVRALAG